MTKQEAMKELRAGNKVTHESFNPSEFIYLERNKIVDENGYMLEPFDFWKYKQDPKFENGWSVYTTVSA